MQMQRISDVGFQERTIPTAIDALMHQAPLDSEAYSHGSATLQSVVHLLSEVARTLAGHNEEARKYILRASALLRAEADLQNGNTPPTTSEPRRRQLAPWQVARVLRFIDANLADKIGPQDFAGLTRCSTSHFARAFRATVGEAPYAYLIRRRVERAKEMILGTDLPLAQVAIDCGLADQAHLTRLFTRMVGVSPGAWRRAHVPNAPRRRAA